MELGRFVSNEPRSLKNIAIKSSLCKPKKNIYGEKLFNSSSTSFEVHIFKVNKKKKQSSFPLHNISRYFKIDYEFLQHTFNESCLINRRSVQPRTQSY